MRCTAVNLNKHLRFIAKDTPGQSRSTRELITGSLVEGEDGRSLGVETTLEQDLTPALVRNPSSKVQALTWSGVSFAKVSSDIFPSLASLCILGLKLPSTVVYPFLSSPWTKKIVSNPCPP